MHITFTFHTGKEKLQSIEGSGEASSSGERTECEAPDNECNEIHATLSACSISDSDTEDPDVRKPSPPSGTIPE